MVSVCPLQRLGYINATAGLYSEYGYEKRLTMLEAEFPGANILLHKLGKLPKVFFVFLSSFLLCIRCRLSHHLKWTCAIRFCVPVNGDNVGNTNI